MSSNFAAPALATLRCARSFAAPARARRSSARCYVSPPVDIDPDQLVWRTGDDARAAADRGGVAARDADADGSADRDGSRAVRAVFIALGRVARSRAQAAGLCDRGIAIGGDCCQRSARVVAGLAVDDVALHRRLRHWHRGDDRRQRGADCSDAGGGTRAPGRGAREECAGITRRPRSLVRARPAC